MVIETNTIMLMLEYKNVQYQVSTSRNRYVSLMTLIADHLSIAGFGQCCGLGSCGTCLVEISQKRSAAKETTLSCGVQIDDYLANTKIVIPEPAY